ncbi:MAG TPA: pyrimidine 5'-nucleotidase [Burkholderiales bacterium]|nr:pyrimidine 5'-nucleotidase [Burkholderiales bacterium]
MHILAVPPSRRVWIFDLDNTLHDARPSIFPSMHDQMNAYLRRHFGLDEAGANEMRRFFWERYGTTLKGVTRHHGHDPKRFIRETHQFAELDAMVAGEATLRHSLARLAGTRLVFSNAPRHYVEGVLRALGVARLFDAVYTIESTRYRPKPAFQGFRALLRRHDLAARRCALIDDQLENLRTAKRLGMSTVWVSEERRRVPFVDLRVDSVARLPRHVFRHSH